jgi:lipoprotein-releasing system permease protein
MAVLHRLALPARRRAEGGVSVMTWISLIGITLAVFALIATLAVRSGFRAEFVDTILGANAHVTVYRSARWTRRADDRTLTDFAEMAERLARCPASPAWRRWSRGRSWPTARAQRGRRGFGIAPRICRHPAVANPEPRGAIGASARASPSARAWRASWAWAWATGSG